MTNAAQRSQSTTNPKSCSARGPKSVKRGAVAAFGSGNSAAAPAGAGSGTAADALDRFGTRLEKRFTRTEVIAMMEHAGLVDVHVSPDVPFWCAVGIRRR